MLRNAAIIIVMSSMYSMPVSTWNTDLTGSFVEGGTPSNDQSLHRADVRASPPTLQPVERLGESTMESGGERDGLESWQMPTCEVF
jgi:hypothetical protein